MMPRKRIAKPISAAWDPDGRTELISSPGQPDLSAKFLRQQQLRAARNNLHIFREVLDDVAAIGRLQISCNLHACECVGSGASIDPSTTLPPDDRRDWNRHGVDSCARRQKGQDVHPWQDAALRSCGVKEADALNPGVSTGGQRDKFHLRPSFIAGLQECRGRWCGDGGSGRQGDLQQKILTFDQARHAR